MIRIGFLFNHDQIHQVAHSLPIALALARSDVPAKIVLIVTSDRLEAEVRRLGGEALSRSRIVIHRLRIQNPVRRVIARATAAIAPASKLLIYGDHADFLASFDMLVVSEKTSLLLKTRPGFDSLRLVHTRHGAGDRAIGFDKASARFDLVLASGHKVRDRLIAEAGVAPDRVRVCGYPKFDLAPASPVPFSGSNGDERPIVLYNPHVSPHLSSWFAMGRAVLDWFARHEEYRLIFAPHVMLFERRLAFSVDRLRMAVPGAIPPHILRAPNIHVDLGSPASTDMTYTRAADLYLGDVSSQVYEFLLQPRPCLFLNAHSRDWHGDPNYAHWAFGPVITRTGQLGHALSDALANHATQYREIQQRAFAATFDLDDTPSSERAARAIAEAAGLAWRPAPAIDETTPSHGGPALWRQVNAGSVSASRAPRTASPLPPSD
jgi:hypothetical protein